MYETQARMRQSIPEHLMLARLAQSEQMREFFVRMWIENPELAGRLGGKVKDLLSPLHSQTETML